MLTIGGMCVTVLPWAPVLRSSRVDACTATAVLYLIVKARARRPTGNARNRRAAGLDGDIR